MSCDLCGADSESITANVSLCPECQETPRGKEIEFQCDLYRTLEGVSTRRTLVQLHVFYYISQLIGMDDRVKADTGGAPTGMIFHGIGLLWSFQENRTRRTDFPSVIGALHEVFESYLDEGTELGHGEASSEYDLQLRNRDLITGRYSHPVQDRRVALERYGRFSEDLKRANGFDVEDSLNYDDSLNKIYDDILANVVNSFSELYEPESQFDDLTTSIWLNKDLMLDEVIPHVNRVSNEVYDDFWSKGSDLFRQIDKTGWDGFTDFLDRMSASIGDAPGVGVGPFVADYEKPYRCPYDVNPMEQYLFAISEGDYLPPINGRQYATIAETFYYDVLNSGISEGRFRNEWGAYVEDILAEDLEKKYCESANIIKNPKYPDPTRDDETKLAETDVILESGNILLIFECKAYPLRAETRSGYSGLPTIREQVREGVGEGYNQALRLIDGIQNGQVRKLLESSGSEYNLSTNYEYLIPIVVMGSHYSELTTSNFLNLLPRVKTIPFAVDLYDIDIIILSSSIPELIEYLETRRYIIREDITIKSNDELDYYWAYAQGIFNPEILGIIQNHQFEFFDRSLTTNVGSILSRYGYDNVEIREKLSARGLTEHIFMSFDSKGYIDSIYLPPYGDEIRKQAIQSELYSELSDIDILKKIHQ